MVGPIVMMRKTKLLRERVGVAREEDWAPVRLGRDNRLSAVPALDRLLNGLAIARRLELFLYQAAVGLRVGTFLLLVAVCGLVGCFVGVALFHSTLGGLVLLGASSLAPFLVVGRKRSIRRRQFAEEFPDALDLLVRVLRSGISFSAALQIVADKSPEPVRSEFAIVVEEQALGLDLHEGLANMANRVGSSDLRFFVASVALQRAAGGSLTEALENTSRLIRDRWRILDGIKSFTAQGRRTGFILSALLASIGLAFVTQTRIVLWVPAIALGLLWLSRRAR